MTTLELTRRADRILERVTTATAPFLLFVVRLFAGGAFLQAGLGKWRNLEGTTTFFESLGLPAPGLHAVLISTLEVVGGFALVLGLATRVFALLLSGTMVVALATADRAALGHALAGSASPTDVAPLVLLVVLLSLFASGAGRFGLDRLVARRLEARRRPS